MRGLANLNYGKKILITNGVKEEFKNIEIQDLLGTVNASMRYYLL